MDTIKELYYGNIHPYEREIKKDSEIDRLAKLVLRCVVRTDLPE